MARRPEDVQIQVVMSDRMRRDLGKAALTHQDDVERDRLMTRGPMLGYIAKWFLAQPQATQLEVVREGKRLLEGGTASVAAERTEAAVREGIAIGAQGRKTNAKRKDKAPNSNR